MKNDNTTPKHTVVITGGTGGLGQAVVQHFLDQGATCWVPERGQAPASVPWKDHPEARIRYGVDVLDPASIQAFYAEAGPIHASIHLVGGFEMAPFSQTTPASFEAMFQLNVMSAVHASHAAIQHMSGGGHIVNVAAKPALIPTGNLSAYSTSKAALVGLTKALAEELLPANIRVNAIAPSIMDTPANRAAMPNADHSLWPKVEEVASAIYFLASAQNQLTTGTILPVYGRA